MAEGFAALQEHAAQIIILVEMMIMGQSDLKCFEEGQQKVLKDLKERFFPRGRTMNREQIEQFVEKLIDDSVDNWRTNVYDKIQYCCQGIL